VVPSFINLGHDFTCVKRGVYLLSSAGQKGTILYLTFKKYPKCKQCLTMQIGSDVFLVQIPQEYGVMV